MKNRIILLFCLFTKMVFSQNCGTIQNDSTLFFTQPWIGDNQFLIDFNDSLANVLLKSFKLFGA